jgi:hypothetical protein
MPQNFEQPVSNLTQELAEEMGPWVLIIDLLKHLQTEPGTKLTLHYITFHSAHSPLGLFSDRLHQVLRLRMLLT